MKRIAELEGIIRTEKSAITKLKKDMAVLEQKVLLCFITNCKDIHNFVHLFWI